MSKVLQERGFGSLPSSTETNPRDHVKSISTTVEVDITPRRRIRSSQYVVLAQRNSKKGSYGPQFLEANSYGALHIDNSIPRMEKDPGSFTLPFYINNVCFDNALADLGASISVMPLSTYLNLGLGELAHTKLMVELADGTVKYPKGIAKNVLVGIEARLMGETLVLNRSLDPLYGDYIELNDLNIPLELRRYQVDDLMLTIEEGKFYNSIIKDKVKYERKNAVGAFMNVPIFVGNYFVVTYFVVMENMDGYRDQDMGDVIFGEPFCKASCVEAKRFDGLITIHNGPEYVRDAKMEEWLKRGHVSMHEMEE
ncbi:ribonuclease H-like domain-containing protein [Tanacetum coccineum]|uniref:Ribonuclease H-like domain-containing protein n=1 Tax=Tanacetum coccineum TaxID=301880 RepID=A0ABQ5BA53_9ASTR